MTVIRASATSTEHSVLARQIAVWPNLIPYHCGPGGLSECSYYWGQGTCSVALRVVAQPLCAMAPQCPSQPFRSDLYGLYVVSCCSPQRFGYCSYVVAHFGRNDQLIMYK